MDWIVQPMAAFDAYGADGDGADTAAEDNCACRGGLTYQCQCTGGLVTCTCVGGLGS